MKQPKKNDILALKEVINKAEYGYLKQLKEAKKFMEFLDNELHEQGLSFDIKSRLGFNPETVYKKEKAAIERAKITLEKIENSTAAQPNRMLNVSYYAVKASIRRMKEEYLFEMDYLPYYLEEQYHFIATLAIQSAELKYFNKKYEKQ